MSADIIIDEDDQYVSSEDSDFAPDANPANVSEASDSEGEDGGELPASKKPRVESKTTVGGEGVGYDSGDEAIIQRGHKRRKRAYDKGLQDDDEGGEGGLIKTRRQRAAEKEERKLAPVKGPVTIDVDAVWAQMVAGSVMPPSETEIQNADTGDDTQDEPRNIDMTADEPTTDQVSDMVRIKRTYNFAGRVHTEEKLVARNSAEAKLYFASQGQEVPETDEALPSKRVARKAFRSKFEPVTDLGPQRTDLNLGVVARMQAGKEAQAKKLNTVEKSRMDWAGFVDKEGIKDELELAGKSKDSYAARQDFLARSEFKRDDEARRARLGVR